MNHTTIAVDISKEVFEIAVSKTPGKVAERCRLRRRDFVPFFVQRQSPENPERFSTARPRG